MDHSFIVGKRKEYRYRVFMGRNLEWCREGDGKTVLKCIVEKMIEKLRTGSSKTVVLVAFKLLFLIQEN